MATSPIDLSDGLVPKDQAIDLSAGLVPKAQATTAPPQPRLGSSVGETLGVVGSHLKSMVAGPYHAIADAPRSPEEQAVVNAGGGGGFGKFGLAADRLLGVTASNQSAKQAKQNFKSGNFDAGMQSAMDAIPFVGPYARNMENEAAQHGAVAALAGAGTDLLAPKIAAKGIGAAASGVGKGLKVASATPESLKLAGSRIVAQGSPGELLQSALKPGVKYGAGVANTLQDALPDVINADPTLKGVGGFAKAADAAKETQFGKYNDIMAPYRPLAGAAGPVRSGSIHGGPIADAQLQSIPAMDIVENNPTTSTKSFDVSAGPDGGTLKMAGTTNSGGIVNNTAAKANAYNKDLSIPLADAVREDANAKLNSFYNKAGGDQNAALSSPETARVKAVGDTTRQLLYPKLETDAALPAGTVAGIQNQFGKLADVADIANKREPVFARHDPVTLSQKIAAAHGGPLATAFNWAKEKALNSMTNSDALVNSAVDRFQNPNGTPLIARPGAVPQIASPLGGTLDSLGGDIRRLPLVYNPALLLKDRGEKKKR